MNEQTIEVPVSYLHLPDINNSEALILAFIRSELLKHEDCIMSSKELAEYLGMHKRNVENIIVRLKRLGYIVTYVERKGKGKCTPVRHLYLTWDAKGGLPNCGK